MLRPVITRGKLRKIMNSELPADDYFSIRELDFGEFLIFVRKHFFVLIENITHFQNQNIEDAIVVPQSSLLATIEMPKYKDIDTPGYRSPAT